MNTDKIYAEQLANEYAPKDTSKVVALRKLDRKAKLPATIFTYTFGIIAALVTGVGMCLSMNVIGSGGYMPEDVRDVQEIMASGKWNLEQIITHEFSLDELEQVIRTAGDVDHAGNVVIKIKDEIGLPTGGDIHIL